MASQEHTKYIVLRFQFRDDSRSKRLCLSSLILSQSISCWGLLNSDSLLLPAVLSRVCFKLLLASLHGFQTAILRTLGVRGPPFVGATAVKPGSAPTWCYHKGFPRSSLCLFPNKFDFYFLYFCFLWAPHCLLVLIFFGGPLLLYVSYKERAFEILL